MVFKVPDRDSHRWAEVMTSRVGETPWVGDEMGCKICDCSASVRVDTSRMTIERFKAVARWW